MTSRTLAVEAPFPNIDLGRAIQSSDIFTDHVSPLLPADVGVYCYECQRHNAWSLRRLTPLNTGTGVFTSRILCTQDSPVWVCLEHSPQDDRFLDAFVPEVREELILLYQKKCATTEAPQ